MLSQDPRSRAANRKATEKHRVARLCPSAGGGFQITLLSKQKQQINLTFEAHAFDSRERVVISDHTEVRYQKQKKNPTNPQSLALEVLN